MLIRPTGKMTDRLLLMHLSDIHFKKPQCLNPDMDRDNPVRVALKNDAVEFCKEHGDVDVILVTGDIAYHADPEEYEVAKLWLDEIANATGCCQGAVYTVPGNHDISWKILKNNDMTVSLRNQVLNVNEPDRYDEFFKIMNDEDKATDLFEPLMPYNTFAARYGCALSVDGRPFWRAEIPLGEHIKIRLHGLTTAIFSGEEDEKGKLYLGDIQTAFEPLNQVINIVLMHHPPDWLSDCDAVEDALWNGTKLHLLGHKHSQRIRNDTNSVKLAAGAVNPARNEANWEPGYNFIELFLSDEDDQIMLNIHSHLRNWQSSPDRFTARENSDGTKVFVNKMIISAIEDKESGTEVETVEVATVQHNDESETMTTGATKNLVYRFWELASSDRRTIANDLHLLSEKELELPEFERYKRAFKNAREHDKIQALSEAIQNVENKD